MLNLGWGESAQPPRKKEFWDKTNVLSYKTRTRRDNAHEIVSWMESSVEK